MTDICPGCGGSDFGERPNGPHIQVFCQNCDQHMTFRKKEEGERRRRRKGSTNLARGKWCHLCLRHKEELRVNDTLEGHHIIEVKDGGSDDPQNIWTLCTSCHSLVGWMRTYHGGHRVDELVRELRKRRDQRVTHQDGREQIASHIELGGVPTGDSTPSQA